MLATLAATFAENGNALAHRMAAGHTGYTHEETETLWERKLAERQSVGLGWPSCSAVQGEGCTSCATCPHLAAGKSPLHLALAAAPATQNAALGQGKPSNNNPVTGLMILRAQGADIKTLSAAMNQAHAVVKYGDQIRVAIITSDDVSFMKVEDFHRMFANLIVFQVANDKDDAKPIKVSKHWFDWPERRQHVGRGVVFIPGGPPEVENDMLNLWRGWGVEPKQGDWSLMRSHIRDVICSGNDEHFQYLIRWMAYGVQHPDRPIGVAIALRGEEGAGKGFLWRNYGKLYGKHFKHVAQGEHLTGRFNAVLGDACAVFLDEALWAGDRKGEQILKALITEDTFQLERKFCDPIPVPNRLRIMIASNNDWIVPVGTKGRRYVVLDVSDRYSDQNDPAHAAYWDPLQAQFGDHAPDNGRAAMLYDLLHMDLSGFNIRGVPKSAAKTEQKLLSLRGTLSWLHQALQEGVIEFDRWNQTGLTIGKVHAYAHYQDFSKRQREWQPEIKDLWSKKLRTALGECVNDTRVKGVRSFRFAPLVDCRRAFASHIGDPDLQWDEPDEAPQQASGAAAQTAEDVGGLMKDEKTNEALANLLNPQSRSRPASTPDARPEAEYEPEDDLDDPRNVEWEPDLEPAGDYSPEH
jgi:hypothetical protein